MKDRNVENLEYYVKARSDFYFHKGLPYRLATHEPSFLIDSGGYLQVSVSIKGVEKRLMAHRLCWFKVHGVLPKGHLDHIDRNKANCAINNLRETTDSHNMRNQTVKGEIPYRGVYLRKDNNKFRARLKVEDKSVNIGHYNTAIEAAIAYDRAVIKHNLEEYTPLNFPL